MPTHQLSLAQYGKDKIRLFRVVRTPSGVHHVAEYYVTALLQGEVDKAWTESDNSSIVATDSIKNTVYLKAKQSENVLQLEKFALELGIHFVTTYDHIHTADITITQSNWTRIPVQGAAHPHSFVRKGDDKRFTQVTVTDSGKGSSKTALNATIQSGLKDLLVLKTTESSFEGFVRDKYTTLPPASDRIFSTSVDCTYDISLPPNLVLNQSTPLDSLSINFDEIFTAVQTTTLEVFATHNSASVQATLYKMCEQILNDNKSVSSVTYKLPNKHYFAVDMTYFDQIDNLSPTHAEVFMPVDAPSGLIIATVVRGAES